MVKKIIGGLIFVAVVPVAWYLGNLPDIAKLKTVNPKSSAIREFREEQVLKKGGKPHSSMVWRSLDQISPYLIHAVILSEDDTFFQHHGFDVEQLKRAAQINWERRRFAFGASTLTQQLARTLYLSSHKNLLRKAKEALITRKLEKNLPKKRILELYLNVVEWGPQVYGAEAASQYFFKKPALDLSAEEAIALVVILPSPTRWNPLKENGFIGRQKRILYDRMVRAKFIVPVISTEPAISLPTEGEPQLIDEQEPIINDAADEDTQ